jgi:hypothetical protein
MVVAAEAVIILRWLFRNNDRDGVDAAKAAVAGMARAKNNAAVTTGGIFLVNNGAE